MTRWGRLDVLVDNAGMTVPGRALDVVTEADWQSVVQVNRPVQVRGTDTVRTRGNRTLDTRTVDGLVVH
ncbi:MAG: SDR family oxidoreductase [Actinomycetota bacterium]|nr:SDR family oxidoreductase [Actinomycetota bacterium]